MSDMTRQLQALKWFGGILFVVMLVLAGTSYLKGASSFPVLVIGGAVLLIATLGTVALCFSIAGMNDNRYAFALPDGSIRAMLALGLFAAFVGIAGYLYNGFTTVPEIAYVRDTTATEDQIAEYSKNFIVIRKPLAAGTTTVPVELYVKVGDRSVQNAADFAKQVFTTVATALVTVIGFYFGNGTLTTAVAAVRAAGQTDRTLTDGEKAASIEAQASQLAKQVADAAEAIAAASKNAVAAAARAEATTAADPVYKTALATLTAAQTDLAVKRDAVTGKLTTVTAKIAAFRKTADKGDTRATALAEADRALAEARSAYDDLAGLRSEVEANTRLVLDRTPPIPQPTAAAEPLSDVRTRPNQEPDTFAPPQSPLPQGPGRPSPL